MTPTGHVRLVGGWGGVWEWAHDGYPADGSPVVGNRDDVTLP
jgi:hypothetical protein